MNPEVLEASFLSSEFLTGSMNKLVRVLISTSFAAVSLDFVARLDIKVRNGDIVLKIYSSKDRFKDNLILVIFIWLNIIALVGD